MLSSDRDIDVGAMYEEVFGFVQSPFTLAPDPRFLYLSASHDEAARLLQQSIRRKEGFIVLTGDIGTGKTTLCRALLDKLDPRVFTSLVLDPFLSVEELLREVLLDFGVVERTGRLAAASKHDLTATLHDFLLSLVPIQGSCVLIVDEAQHLSPEVLEQIRVLSNLETNSQKLLQIVLVGQLNLLDVLAAADMRQLDQRISMRVMLRPLTKHEVDAYISHRLAVAGSAAPIAFSAEATARVHATSGGVPRVINLMCDRALMIAAERGLSLVTPRVIDEAAARLQFKGHVGSGRWRRRPVPMLMALAAAVAVIASILIFAPLSQLVDAPLPAVPPSVPPRVAPLLRPVAPPDDAAPVVPGRRTAPPASVPQPSPSQPRVLLPSA